MEETHDGGGEPEDRAAADVAVWRFLSHGSLLRRLLVHLRAGYLISFFVSEVTMFAVVYSVYGEVAFLQNT